MWTIRGMHSYSERVARPRIDHRLIFMHHSRTTMCFDCMESLPYAFLSFFRSTSALIEVPFRISSNCKFGVYTPKSRFVSCFIDSDDKNNVNLILLKEKCATRQFLFIILCGQY